MADLDRPRRDPGTLELLLRGFLIASVRLLTSERDRIARRLAFLDAHITAGDIGYNQARAHLDDCLTLAGNCHDLYTSIDDSLRRIANQAFFDKLFVQPDSATIEGPPEAAGLSGPSIATYDYFSNHQEVGMAVHIAEAPALDPLMVANAAAELAGLRRLRAVARAAAAGRTQRDIAAALDVSQSAVYKMLVHARHTPGLDETTPWETVLRYAAGEIDHRAALEALAAWPWTADRILDPDATEPAQFVPGDWHDLERAVRARYLTDDDYDAILAYTR